MGVQVSWSNPITGSSWDTVNIYSSTSSTGTFSLVSTAAITATTYYDSAGTSGTWYKIKFSVGTASYSDYSDVLSGAQVTTYYTTPARVASLLGYSAGFTANTVPSVTEVTEFIQYAEDEIETITGHAWRSKTVTREYHNITFPYRYGSGVRIDLAHRSVRTMSTATDKIEVWEGSSWVDWLATKTEGRGSDFWVDYENGILYLYTYFPWVKESRVRVTYRYGETSVPGDITQACTMMVAQNMLMANDRTMIVPEGGAGLGLGERINIYKDRVDDILAHYAEIRVMNK